MSGIPGAFWQRNDEKPLVFISATRSDRDWQEGLKIRLDAYTDQIEWWDASRIKTTQNWKEEVDAAIERASVAVIFLSPAYLMSETATSELMRLGQQAESKSLTLFPIILEDCPWQQYSFLRNVLIWADARPIGNLNEEAAAREASKIAESIRDFAISTSSYKTDQSQLRFSPSAIEVLEHSWALAKRGKSGVITASCLLFAIVEAERSRSTNTSRFVTESLVHGGRYDDEFDAFLRDLGTSTIEPFLLRGVPWGISETVARLLRDASTIANNVSLRSRAIDFRHLFAALISPQFKGSRSVRQRLTRLGVDLPSLRLEFREHIREVASFESSLEWDDVLGILRTAPTPSIFTSQTVEQTPSAAGATTYKSTYSAFIPDRTSYGPRDTAAPLDDSLGVRTYASHLAQLIAAKETFMPLSIGLFGAWGAGKSHFMDLMDEQLREITKEPGRAFHKQIVQIHFNAWHYLDTNLWANLVSEIFDQLFDAVESRGEKEAKQVENLKNRLADQSALAAEAKAALVLAENVRKDAETQLRSAMKQRTEQENRVSTLLDDLRTVVVDDKLKQQLRDVANGLGLPKVESSFKELEERAAEVHSLGGRIRALMLTLFTGSGWWKRGLLLIVALASPLVVSWLAVHGAPWTQDLLAGVGRTIAQVVTAIAALSTWLATQARAGNTLVAKLENAYDRVSKIRADREAKDDAAKAQAILAEKIQAEEQARHMLHEAEEKLKNIKAELAEMAPGRQLIRFLRERAATEDYRRHLGLVSLVRKDFEQLSNLLTAVKSEDGELPKIDRIVLYIDDLDRCRAERVVEVLEAVHLLLAFPLFTVVVAVDPRWLRQSLLDHYPRLLGGSDDDKTKTTARSLGRPATPQDYLEKIFQVPFNLQPMEKAGFDALVKHLFTVDGTRLEEPQPVIDIQIIQAPRGDSDRPPPKRKRDQPQVPAPTITQESSPAQPQPMPQSEPKPAPPDPERLELTQNEIDDIQRFQTLFQTPRAVKRLANTYSLIRVGIDKEDWDNYLSFNETTAGYRVPLLLLAVASAFPVLARPWLLWLRETPPTNWQLDNDTLITLVAKHDDTTDRGDWEKLQHCLNRLDLDGWPPPDHDVLAKWLPRVARYSF